MTTQQDLRSADLAQLTALYEGGNYAQALQTIDGLGLPSLLKEQPDAPGHASLALLVANVYREMARYDKADEYYLQALAGLKHTLGQDHPGYARGLVELGTLYQLMGQYDEARRFFEKARDVHEAAAPPDPVAHSRSLQALAGLHDALGKRREAKACLTQARTLLEGAGASPVETADLLLKEAWVLCRLDNLHAVVSRARQALAIYRELKGEHHPCTLQAGYQLGRLLVALCHLDEAAPLLEGLLMARREMLSEDHPDHAAAVAALALLRLVQGEPGEAENLARRSLALTTAALGEHHLDVAARHRTLGHILEAGNRFPAAAESYEQALAIVRNVLGEEHPQIAETRFDLAKIHEAMGEHREAVERVRATLDLLDRSPEDVRYEQVTGCLSLARLRANAGVMDDNYISRRRQLDFAIRSDARTAFNDN